MASLVGRGETQAATLLLGCLLLALRFVEGSGRWWIALALAILCYFVANLTKESAAVAPALLFLALAYAAQGGLAARFASALRRGLAYYAGSAVTLGVVFAIRARVLGGALKAGHTGIFELENALARLPPFLRASNACVLFFRMLGRLVLPLRLSSDESAWSIRPVSARDLLAWGAPLLAAALVAAAVPRLREASIPAVGFFFLAIAALPTSNLLFPTGTIFAERLAYLPSAGLCLILAAWIVGEAPSFEVLRPVRLAVLAAVVVAFGARTVVRNPVWQSDDTLFTNMVRVSPRSAKAHYDYAYMSAEAKQPRRALEHYVRATEIYPGYWDAWAGRGRMERELGDPSAAEKSCLEAIRINPGYESGYFGLGMAREAKGDVKGAEQAYRDGLRRNPRSLPLAYRFALLVAAQGRPEALFAWRRTLTIEPRSLPSQRGLKEWLERSAAPLSGPAGRGEARSDVPPPSASAREGFAATAGRSLGHARVPSVVQHQGPVHEGVGADRDDDREQRRPDEKRRQAGPKAGPPERDPEVVVEDALPPERRYARGVVSQDRAAEPVSHGEERRQGPRVADERAEHRVELVEPERQSQKDRQDEMKADERRQADAHADRDGRGDTLGGLLPAHQVEKDLQAPALPRQTSPRRRACRRRQGRRRHRTASKWSWPSSAISRSPLGPASAAPAPEATRPMARTAIFRADARSSKRAASASRTVKSSS